MTVVARWQAELEAPTPAFFDAFAERVAAPDGIRDGVREAVKGLVPRLDWEAYLPHVPHGILGLRAVLRLRPLLAETSFLRALGTQLFMAAREGRRSRGAIEQVAAARGSGTWRNLEAFILARKPGLAYAEAQGFEQPGCADFQRLAQLVAADMANVGHKAVFARQLEDLHERLEQPRATGRRLLGVAAWLAATAEDTFWARRAAARLGGALASPSARAAELHEAGLQPLVREICDLGLVDLLDALAARLRAGLGQNDLLAALVLAASEKQLDARRDLEGKTAWNFVYLATLAGAGEPVPSSRWCQAAALVNLFPTDEPGDRIEPQGLGAPSAAALLDAILDGELMPAMSHARALVADGQGQAVLAALAEAATRNDPAFNHAHQILAVAGAADLVPRMPACARSALLVALAKSLANSQGSGELGARADRAIQQR